MAKQKVIMTAGGCHMPKPPRQDAHMRVLTGMAKDWQALRGKVTKQKAASQGWGPHKYNNHSLALTLWPA